MGQRHPGLVAGIPGRADAEQRIASMIASEADRLVSSTFSDHILKYFGAAFNANNIRAGQ